MKLTETSTIKDQLYDHRKKAWADRKKTHKSSGKWNASQLGACKRKQFLKRMGALETNPPSIESMGKMNLGILHEKQLLDEMAKAGIGIIDQMDNEQEGVETDTVVGRLDGTIDDTNLLIENEPIEIKSQASRAFWHKNKEQKANDDTPVVSNSHLFQLLFYMMVKGKNKGRFFYVSKDDNTIKEITLEADEADFQMVRDRISELDKFWYNDILPEAVPEEKWECDARFCGYHSLCKLIGKEECHKQVVKQKEEEYKIIGG
jgi:hypothetical protein